MQGGFGGKQGAPRRRVRQCNPRNAGLTPLLFTSLAIAAPNLTHEVVTDGPVRKRLSDVPADVVLLYGGEQHGVLGPCGCDERPKGGLDRALRYFSAVAERDAGVLLVNTGGWAEPTTDLQGRPTLEAAAATGEVVRNLTDWHAVNVGWRDIPAVQLGGVPAGAVSANVDGVERWRDLGEVVVTGVTGAGPGARAAADVSDGVDAVRELLPELTSAGSIVVVLAYEMGPDTERLAGLPGVDVVIEAGGFEQSHPPWADADTVWVRSRYETQRIGELRLSVADGVVTGALDRHIDLDRKVR